MKMGSQSLAISRSYLPSLPHLDSSRCRYFGNLGSPNTAVIPRYTYQTVFGFECYTFMWRVYLLLCSLLNRVIDITDEMADNSQASELGDHVQYSI